MLDTKLQIKQGQRVAILHAPAIDLDIEAPAAGPADADVILVFCTNRAELDTRIGHIAQTARRGATTWLAYPKARQLGTDLDRDSIHALMPDHGLTTVRQISIDDIWSALRLKPTVT